MVELSEVGGLHHFMNAVPRESEGFSAIYAESIGNRGKAEAALSRLAAYARSNQPQDDATSALPPDSNAISLGQTTWAVSSAIGCTEFSLVRGKNSTRCIARAVTCRRRISVRCRTSSRAGPGRHFGFLGFGGESYASRSVVLSISNLRPSGDSNGTTS